MNRETAECILGAVGGRPNVLKVSSCMTRLRLTLCDPTLAALDPVRALPGVLGAVLAGNQAQVVLGPGKAQEAATVMDALLAEQPAGLPIGEAETVRAAVKARSQSPAASFLARLSGIFIPLIPAIVASGMLAGLTNVALRLGADPQNAIIQVLQVTGWAIFAYLAIFVGFQTAKECGGSPSLGGLAGVLLINPAIADIRLGGTALVPGQGGIFGVLIVAGLMAWIERRIRRQVPQSLDIIVTPTLTLLAGCLLAYLVLQPLSGLLADGVVGLFRSAIDAGGILAGAVLAGTFLPLVMTGLHQGLTPVHMEFLNSLRVNPLLPILAMAGAGQVGASLAVLWKTRNRRLRAIVKSALPVGFLGIGEPLIFGVTLPLGRPFAAACLGAAAGGAVQSYLKVQSVAMGVSGLPLAFLIRGDQVAHYLLGLIVAYAAGFLIAAAVGFEDPPDPGDGEEGI